MYLKFGLTTNQLLDGITLIKFQKYIDRLFQGPKLKKLKPPSIFDAVAMNSKGVNFDQFEKWVVKNLTYDDTEELSQYSNLHNNSEDIVLQQVPVVHLTVNPIVNIFIFLV